HFQLVARDFGLLDSYEIFGELLAEAFDEASVFSERCQRLFETPGQSRGGNFVRRICRRTGIELLLDAVQTRDDLRSHIEVTIGCGFPPPIFEARGRFAPSPDYPNQRPFIVPAPNDTIGREGMGPVALVPIDGRGGERGGSARVRQQPGEEMASNRRKSFSV